MKKSLLLLFVIAISCQNQPAKKQPKDQSHNAKNSLDYVGTYKGILPCADCHGLETEIVINENSTFCLKTKYQGKGDKVYMQKGHFSWNKSGNIIILTDMKNAPNKYFVSENKLTQLNMYGKKVTGNLADEYILTKQPADTSDMETASGDNSATVDLNSRIATTTSIERVNPAIGKYTLAETKWKLTQLKGKTVNQKGKKAFTLKLNSKDGRFSAYMGCNSIGGNYIMPSTDKLAFSDVFMTEMACADMATETNFAAVLQQTAIYKLEKETLTLFSEKKRILAKFEAMK